MKNLNFKLICDKEIKIDRNVNYYIKDNELNFKIDEDIFKYNLNSNILIKTNKESIITMDFENYNIIIEVLDNNLMFNMEIKEYNIHVSNNEINIKYKYLGEKLQTNEIFIKY